MNYTHQTNFLLLILNFYCKIHETIKCLLTVDSSQFTVQLSTNYTTSRYSSANRPFCSKTSRNSWNIHVYYCSALLHVCVAVMCLYIVLLLCVYILCCCYAHSQVLVFIYCVAVIHILKYLCLYCVAVMYILKYFCLYIVLLLCTFSSTCVYILCCCYAHSQVLVFIYCVAVMHILKYLCLCIGDQLSIHPIQTCTNTHVLNAIVLTYI